MKTIILSIQSFHEGQCKSIKQLRKDIKKTEDKYDCFINFLIQDERDKPREPTREKD